MILTRSYNDKLSWRLKLRWRRKSNWNYRFYTGGVELVHLIKFRSKKDNVLVQDSDVDPVTNRLVVYFPTFFERKSGTKWVDTVVAVWRVKK